MFFFSKKCFSQKWAKFEVIGHFLELELLILAGIVNYDTQLWYIIGNGVFSSFKISGVPQIGSKGPLMPQIWWFWSLLLVLNISFGWYCTLWYTIITYFLLFPLRLPRGGLDYKDIPLQTMYLKYFPASTHFNLITWLINFLDTRLLDYLDDLIT